MDASSPNAFGTADPKAFSLDDKIKPSDSYNKESLLKLVALADNIAIRAGKMPKGIETWEAMPWMMPAVQLWFNLLMKFEGAAEHVSGNLMQDYNDTAALGLASKGKAMINISEVDCRITEQLDAALK
eukprot:1995635-Rhodomonas_salina.1